LTVRRGCLWVVIILIALIALAGAFVLGLLVGAALSGNLLWFPSTVAVLEVNSTIQSGEQTGLFSSGTFSRTFISQLDRARRQPRVRAILIRVNSPGGNAVASDEIYREIRRTRQEFHKPVVVYMESLAASGGYYISAAADRIVANPNTLTGSIGVITVIPTYDELLNKIGVKVYVFRSGAFKDTTSGIRPLRPEEEALMQELVNQAYQRFVDVVAEGRNLPRDRVLQFADGRVLTGTQAQGLGLVDELGDYHRAIQLAAELAGIRGEPRLENFSRRGGLSGLLGSFGVVGPAGVAGSILGVENGVSLMYLYTGF